MKGVWWLPVVSCEHGGNQVPPEYRYLFVGQKDALASHRGYDPGALPLARIFAEQLAAPLFFSEQTRLLVDLNRSLGHSNLFGAQVKGENRELKNIIIANYYQPYREDVRNSVAEKIAGGAQVVHLSVHSFTPLFEGQQRHGDIGLLYDPARYQEKSLCRRWHKEIVRCLPLRVRYNWPYRGIADGLVRSLRQEFHDDQYLGIEVEINQGALQPDGCFPGVVCQALAGSLNTLFAAQQKDA